MMISTYISIAEQCCCNRLLNSTNSFASNSYRSSFCPCRILKAVGVENFIVAAKVKYIAVTVESLDCSK